MEVTGDPHKSSFGEMVGMTNLTGMVSEKMGGEELEGASKDYSFLEFTINGKGS